MANDTNYPNQYELSQALTEFTHKRFVVEFSQSKGIFITNSNQKDYADFLSGIFWDNDDLEEIRNVALNLNIGSSVSGFWLKSHEGDYDLIRELDRNSNTTINTNNCMILGAVTGDDSRGYKGHVDYLQKQPGRVEFLQGTQRSFDYRVKKKNNGNWEILVDGERPNDAKLFKAWIETVIPRGIDVVVIDQEKLSTEKTIQFFDQLASRGLSNEWRIQEVKRIVVKNDTENCDDEEEDNSEEVESSMLTGISQAIIEGNDLRTNYFVKKCEESGYRFTAMTYKYEHKEHPYVIEIRAEFKGRPKVFEVSLENYYEREGLDGVLHEAIPSFDKNQLLSQFYSEAKYLYDDLVYTSVPLLEEHA